MILVYSVTQYFLRRICLFLRAVKPVERAVSIPQHIWQQMHDEGAEEESL